MSYIMVEIRVLHTVLGAGGLILPGYSSGSRNIIVFNYNRFDYFIAASIKF